MDTADTAWVPSERKFRGTEGSIGTKVQWVPVPFVSMVLVPRVPFVSMVPVPRVPFVSKVPLFRCSVCFTMVEHAEAPVGSADYVISYMIYYIL